MAELTASTLASVVPQVATPISVAIMTSQNLQPNGQSSLLNEGSLEMEAATQPKRPKRIRVRHNGKHQH
jgi:hypothetical protein